MKIELSAQQCYSIKLAVDSIVEAATSARLSAMFEQLPAMEKAATVASTKALIELSKQLEKLLANRSVHWARRSVSGYKPTCNATGKDLVMEHSPIEELITCKRCLAILQNPDLI